MSMCCISTTKRIYYCECSILSQHFAAKSAVVVAVVGQASWPNVWHQRVWISIWALEQCLSSGTMSGFWNSVWYRELWNNNGLTWNINRQLSLSAGTQPYSNIITSEYTCICPYNSSMSIANFQYFHNQRRWRIAVKQIQLGSTNVSDVNQGWML